MNKEKEGVTIRFSVRLPKEQHKWLKGISEETRIRNNYMSMNDFISLALDLLKDKIK